MEAIPELSMTVDRANTTALHIAAAQGHTEVVSFLLETGCSLMSIARSNGKTALHTAAREGAFGGGPGPLEQRYRNCNKKR